MEARWSEEDVLDELKSDAATPRDVPPAGILGEQRALFDVAAVEEEYDDSSGRIMHEAHYNPRNSSEPAPWE